MATVAVETLLLRLGARIDYMWTKYEETGDERYADMALASDCSYRQLRRWSE